MKIQIKNLSKSYHSQNVLENLTCSFSDSCVHALTGPSGQGKTTLLRILLGLESADSGSVDGLEGKKKAAVFQENRLCEDFSALENLLLLPSSSRSSLPFLTKELSKILPENCLKKTVSELSGGMKRRVCIAMAMLSDADVIFMDEPFSGLDLDTKKTVASFVLQHRRDRLLLFTTHQAEEIALLNAEEFALPSIPSFASLVTIC